MIQPFLSFSTSAVMRRSTRPLFLAVEPLGTLHQPCQRFGVESVGNPDGLVQGRGKFPTLGPHPSPVCHPRGSSTASAKSRLSLTTQILVDLGSTSGYS